MRRIALVSGTSNPKLAARISDVLDISLVDPHIERFANGEIWCQIEKSVRGADVYVVQSTCPPVNDNIMELLITIDALKRASAQSITVVMSHYGYSRQDRMAHARTPITAKLVADLLETAGATRVITMDLHAGQIQGFFSIPFDNVYASNTFLNYIKKNLMTENSICIAPDAGGMTRVRHYAKRLNCEIAMIDKRRTGKNIAEAMHIIGDVKDKECIIIDDIIDTAGTLITACETLKKNGATKIYALMTHPILSDPAVERINDCEALEKLIVTNTIPLKENALSCKKIQVLDISDVFANAIHRTFRNESVSTLFFEAE